ncbi:MAG: hypothetical protein R3C44_24590 [Chloroflexota bacterium]
MTVGPLHLMVLAFDEPNFEGWVIDELDFLRESGIITVVDALAVYKTPEGDIESLQESDLDLEDRVAVAGVIGGLIGLGADGAVGAVEGALDRMETVAENEFGFDDADIEAIADIMDNDSMALILLFEHTWAVGLKEAVQDAGGRMVAQGILTPAALVNVGAMLEEAYLEDGEEDEA